MSQVVAIAIKAFSSVKCLQVPDDLLMLTLHAAAVSEGSSWHRARDANAQTRTAPWRAYTCQLYPTLPAASINV